MSWFGGTSSASYQPGKVPLPPVLPLAAPEPPPSSPPVVPVEPPSSPALASPAPLDALSSPALGPASSPPLGDPLAPPPSSLPVAPLPAAEPEVVLPDVDPLVTDPLPVPLDAPEDPEEAPDPAPAREDALCEQPPAKASRRSAETKQNGMPFMVDLATSRAPEAAAPRRSREKLLACEAQPYKQIFRRADRFFELHPRASSGVSSVSSPKTWRSRLNA
jgi:hypothetical protein